MSIGRWTMRGWTFQNWTFAPWTLANSGLKNIDGDPVSGWSIGHTERVFSAPSQSRVWETGHSTRVFEVTEKH